MKEEFAAPSEEDVEKLCSLLDAQARQGGYNLNNDADFVRGLVRGLIVNEKRYGYRACPCRLAFGEKAEDLDIICPCDYRDADLTDFGACYCALYVSKAVLSGSQELSSIPERRPPAEERKRQKEMQRREEEKSALKRDLSGATFRLSLPVWRCTVCGYLCAREAPPEICPICKVGKERFERFI
jgi:ferredoxin-thioredoxin reductase catalytic chain